MHGFESRQQAIDRARSEGGADLDPAGTGRVLEPGDIATTEHSSGLAIPARTYSGLGEHQEVFKEAAEFFRGKGGSITFHSIWPKPPPPEPIVLEAPVIGYRSWELSALGLDSVYVNNRWDGPVVRAECDCGKLWNDGAYSHRAPQYDCSCGLYAYYEPRDHPPGGPAAVVEGAVLAWGDNFFAHREGFRAEYMRILALAIHSGAHLVRGFVPKPLRALLGAIAEEFEASLVPDTKTLELVAREHGDPIPEHARLA